MKRIVIMVLLAALLATTGGCAGATPETLELSDYFGEYKFSEVALISMLSSSTIDYMNEVKADNTYTLTDELFEIRGSGNTITVDKPTYEPCSLPTKDEVLALGGEISELVEKYKIDAAYKVFNADGEKVGRKIYTSSANPDLLWLSDYNDNNATGAEIVVQSVDQLTRE